MGACTGMSANPSPHILSSAPSEGPSHALPECLAEAFRGSLLQVVEFPHFRSGPKAAVEALAVGPSVGCHVFLRHGTRIGQAAALRAVAATLRSAGIPARLPCRVWLLGEDDASSSIRVATVTRAGSLSTSHLEPIAIRNALIQSIRSVGPLRAKQDRIAATQDALRLFREPVLASHAPPPQLPAPGGLAADIAHMKAELQRAELDREQVLARASAWRRGARLVRGVAGSGKTCVMAWATAMLVRDLQADPDRQPPRMLVVSPFEGQRRDLATRIKGCLSLEAATGSAAAMPRWIRIGHWSQLVKALAREMRVKDVENSSLVEIERAVLDAVRAHKPSLGRWMFDAIVVDEAQALSETAISILTGLSDPQRTGDPTLHLYFDDAQSAEGMPRRQPLWKRLGVRVQGRRSVLLDRCYRTPVEIMEPAFNMLIGSLVGFEKPRTSTYADLERLCRRGLIDPRPDGWHTIRFAVRHGPDPEVRCVEDSREALDEALRLTHQLITKERVEPADIAVITPDATGCRGVLQASARLKLSGLRLQSSRSKNPSRGSSGEPRRDEVALRPVDQVRGLEWPVVILVGWDRLASSSAHRSSLYIAMTRAQHMLHLITDASGPLTREIRKCVDRARMVRLEHALEREP